MGNRRRFRRTVKVVSLAGLVVTLAAWGISYWVADYSLMDDRGHRHLGLRHGQIQYAWIHVPIPDGTPMGAFTLWPYDPPTRWLPVVRLSWPYAVCIPLWIPTMVFLALLGLSLRRSGPLGFCVECGYDLTGLSSLLCPECGTRWTPAAEPSGQLGRSRKRVVRWQS